MAAVSVLFDKYNVFPKFQDVVQCHFNPANLDMEKVLVSSDPESTVREQLFGRECDDEASQQYLSHLNGYARRAAEAMLEQIAQVLAPKHRADADARKEAHEAEQEQEQTISNEVTVTNLIDKLAKDSQEGDAEEEEVQ